VIGPKAQALVSLVALAAFLLITSMSWRGRLLVGGVGLAAIALRFRYDRQR
jgi:hypothetical protein